MNFNKDLCFGKTYEKKLLRYLPNVFQHSFTEGLCKAYDLKVLTDKGVEVLYEVKADRHTARTGNICIEFACHGKDSGISTTESHYWGIFVVQNGKEDNLYIVETGFIRQLIQDTKYQTIKMCGDHNRSRCYLFKEKLFEQYRLQHCP
jgi:hypothetical protein